MDKIKLPERYHNFIRFLDEEYNIVNIFEFDEKIALEIMQLKNPAITARYSLDKWNELCNLCIETQSMALLKALFCCENLPSPLFVELDNKLEIEEFESLPLISEYVPKKVVGELCDYYELALEHILENEGEFYSNKALESMCEILTEEEMKNAKYLPYQFLKENSSLFKEIPYMIINENEKYFDEIPEEFLTAIANNIHLPDEVRDMAFDKGYKPYNLTCFTDHMKENIYCAYAETIFDIEDSEIDKDTKDNILYRLGRFISSKNTPVGCKLDFINRFADNPLPDNKILKSILKSTDSPIVLKTALQKFSNEDVKFAVMENTKNITNEVFNELMKSYSPQQLQLVFLNTIPYNLINYDTQTEFLKLNDPYLNRAMIITNQMDMENLVLYHTQNSPEYDELKFLSDLKSTVDFLPLNLSKKILAYAATELLEKDYETKKHMSIVREEFSKTLKSCQPSKWLAMTKGDSAYLKSELNDMREKDPKFNDIIDKLIDKLDNTRNKSYLINKYNNIFITKINDTTSEKYPFFLFTPRDADICCEFINMDAVYKLSDMEMYKFIDDVTKYGHIELWKNLKIVMAEYINDIYTEQDTMFLKVYKFADLYNAIEEKIQEYNKENNIEIEKEETEWEF